MQYQLYTLLVFDKQQNGIPVAWVVSSRNRSSDISLWFSKLMERGRQLKADWTVNAFMTDDALAEIDAIRFFLQLAKTVPHVFSSLTDLSKRTCSFFYV